jgi:hypothetical protein
MENCVLRSIYSHLAAFTLKILRILNETNIFTELQNCQCASQSYGSVEYHFPYRKMSSRNPILTTCQQIPDVRYR